MLFSCVLHLSLLAAFTSLSLACLPPLCSVSLPPVSPLPLFLFLSLFLHYHALLDAGIASPFDRKDKRSSGVVVVPLALSFYSLFVSPLSSFQRYIMIRFALILSFFHVLFRVPLMFRDSWPSRRIQVRSIYQY